MAMTLNRPKKKKQLSLLEEEIMLYDITYKEISQETGVSVYYIHKAQDEPENVPAGDLHKIAQFFGHTIYELFGIY